MTTALTQPAAQLFAAQGYTVVRGLGMASRAAAAGRCADLSRLRPAPLARAVCRRKAGTGLHALCGSGRALCGREVRQPAVAGQCLSARSDGTAAALFAAAAGALMNAPANP